jgi:N-acetylated-alpha-linked acidic dipeptidase
MKAIPDARRIREYARAMSAKPHHAGSPGSKAVAGYALQLLRGWGLQAHLEEFEALLPYPVSRSLELTSPIKYRARLREPVVATDPDSTDAGQLPAYNAYSASGTVAGEVVYVNYGIPEDYEVLDKLGISVKGRIVIARYGRSWRGTKAKVAQEHGAIGCIIYSDPEDDGYRRGDSYPLGPWRPPAGVQRGSVMDMPLYVGDPLSPGWASERGTKRLPLEQAAILMKIPVLPVSYRDAEPVLANLDGPVAPEAWHGALPFTYHVGPGKSQVRLSVRFDQTSKPLYNVIATIPGTTAADEWVLYGNHHDAWVNGASDPVSGASVLLETARTLSEMARSGWKPKRTIKLALWDAEEFGLIGSTEWTEKHLEELKRKLALYVNSDMNTAGRLNAGGSPLLEVFMSEVLRDSDDPKSGKPLLPREFRLGALGAGSDYVAFVHHAGIASLNLGFSGGQSAGIYHSIYDSYAWYTQFGDPDFLYCHALSQIMAIILTRFADAEVLPFEFGRTASAVRRWSSEIEKIVGGKITLKGVVDEAERIDAAARDYESRLDSLAASAPKAELNAELIGLERTLTVPAGLPRRSWYKHTLYAPGVYTGYGAKTLPGIREAVEARRWDEATAQAAAVAAALRSFRQQIQRLTSSLAR